MVDRGRIKDGGVLREMVELESDRRGVGVGRSGGEKECKKQRELL